MRWTRSVDPGRMVLASIRSRRIAMKSINVGLLGIGTVGGGTFAVLARNQEEIARRAGRAITMKIVADKDLERAREHRRRARHRDRGCARSRRATRTSTSSSS